MLKFGLVSRSVARFLVFLLLCSFGHGTLVKSYSCWQTNETNFKLAPLILDVVLDKNNLKLQFYITSKVINAANALDALVMIYDVNEVTNRWTNLNVKIIFMNTEIVNENLRFCDIVSVKNTSRFLRSPRFSSIINKHTPIGDYSASTRLFEHQDNDVNRFSFDDNSIESGNDNDKGSSIKIDIEVENVPSPSVVTRLEPLYQYYSQNGVPGTSITAFDYALFNASSHQYHCPLYVNDTIMLFYQADLNEKYHSLGSFTVIFTLIGNDANSTVLSCSKQYITPSQPSQIEHGLLILALALLLISALINSFTIMYSAHQESSNPLIYTASTICNESLLKQLSCTVYEFIVFMQFSFFVGALDLQYPGYLQPLLADLKWSALLGLSIKQTGKKRDLSQDNIYATFFQNGLQGLINFSTDLAPVNSWPNFMIILCCWIFIQVVAEQVFIYLKEFIAFVRGGKYMVSMSNTKLSVTKNLCLQLGSVLNIFMDLFAFPFLTFTIYVFVLSMTSREEDVFWIFSTSIKDEIFRFNTSYDQIIMPTRHFYASNNRSFGSNGSFNGTRGGGGGFRNQLAPGGVNLTNLAPGTPANQTRFLKFLKTYRYEVPTLQIVGGAILFALWMSIALFFVFRYIFKIQFSFRRPIVPNPKVSKLYTSLTTILIWGFNYNHLEPRKVWYAVFGYVLVLLKLIIISAIQQSGVVQVTLLSVTGIVECAVFVYFKPYYIRTPWYSIRCILPFSRLLITFLCIPYIKGLEVSEAQRTYVGYAQMSIIVFVTAIFAIQLFYGFGKTLISIYKKKVEDSHDKKECLKREKMKRLDSIEELNKHFEYLPMSDMNKSRSENPDAENDDDTELYESYFRSGPTFQKRINFGKEFNYDMEVIPSRFSPERAFRPTSPSNRYDDSDHLLRQPAGLFSDVGSFQEQQMTSDRRKKMNDYTFREGDLIYKKYIVDESIDPEIKALWDSRNLQKAPVSRTPVTLPNQQIKRTTNSSTNLLSKIFTSKTKKKNNEVKRFEVMRPMLLVVKTIEEVQAESNSRSKFIAFNQLNLDDTLSVVSPNDAAVGTEKSDS